MIDDLVVVGGNDEAFGEIGEKSFSNSLLDVAYDSLLETNSVDSSLSAKVSDCHTSFTFDTHLYVYFYQYFSCNHVCCHSI